MEKYVEEKKGNNVLELYREVRRDIFRVAGVVVLGASIYLAFGLYVSYNERQHEQSLATERAAAASAVMGTEQATTGSVLPKENDTLDISKLSKKCQDNVKASRGDISQLSDSCLIEAYNSSHKK
ncbi:hypothetical protein [Paraburkholderia saeva]|uniref:hypothetical protein n=1 Tax=Paraburkholderia saeva TaxID=2777537 RepID=UPI001E2B3BC1|nr:hypothetical protein [Paraburkholderia saeva]